ncbi:hypothetical protein MCEMIH16_03375 [Caulobacteraceae bacterium]|jgi:hypothetical protein
MPSATGPDNVHLRHLLIRIGDALSSAADLSDDCQRYVGELIDGAEAVDGDHHRLQQLDLLSQTLHDLTGVIARTAARVPPDVSIDLSAVLSTVGLNALARTLAGADTRDHQIAGEFELF